MTAQMAGQIPDLSSDDNGSEFRARILVVDDSRIQRRIVRAQIEPLGYEVLEARDGQEALEMLANDPVPLVICDWMMPGLTGPEVCQRIRALRQDLYTYVILLTARTGKQDIVEGLNAGADDFMTKPVDEGELLARLTAGRRRVEIHSELIAHNNKVASAYRALKDLYGRIEADLRAAAALQREFVPERHAQVNGCNLAAHCRFAGHVGGDVVGFFPAPDGRVGLYSIDVAGHGVASALVAIRLAQHFNARDPDNNIAFAADANGILRPRSPDEVMTELNARFLTGSNHDVYFTMAYALCDPARGSVTLCQAGHAPAAIVSPDGTVRFAELGGPPVGLLESSTYGCEEHHLAPGERLVLYSDGITEAACSNGEMLGQEGFARLLTQTGSPDLESFVPALLHGLNQWADGQPQDDDLSLVALEQPSELTLQAERKSLRHPSSAA